MSLSPGAAIATRYFAPDRFVMTAGVVMPFDVELLEDVVAAVPQVTRKPPAEAIDDRRLAEALYREGIAGGAQRKREVQGRRRRALTRGGPRVRLVLTARTPRGT